MVARRISLDDGDSWTDDTNAAVRVQRIRVVDWDAMPNRYGLCNVLLLLPHV